MNPSNDPTTITSQPRRLVSRAWWPHPRRLLTWVLLAPALATTAWLLSAPDDAWGATAAVLTGAIGAATLAHYVPSRGTRLELGCEPCAIVAGLSVPIAIGMLAGVGPLLGLVVAGAGLFQRLNQPDTCPA